MKPTLIKIQHPLDMTGMTFEERVYKAQMRDVGQGWYALDQLNFLENEDPHPEMPILHKGYFESHAHALWACRRLSMLDLSPARTFDEMLRLLIEAQPGPDGLVRAFDWDESRMGVSLAVFVEKLSKAFPNHHPILATRVCGHSAIANKAFCELFGLNKQSALIQEAEYFDLLESLPKINSQASDEKNFQQFQEFLIARGISALSEMSVSDTDLDLLERLCDNGSLLIDTMLVLDEKRAPKSVERGAFFKTNRLALGPTDHKASLSVRHWKRYLDGSFGSRTAWLSQPYHDGGDVGESQYDFEELLDSARKALVKGFCLSFHAIGDAALDQVLKLGQILKEPLRHRALFDGQTTLPRTKHRIEHAQLIREDQLRELQLQNFWCVCIQPCHRFDDSKFVVSRLGKERFENEAYRAGSLLQSHIPIALGTDAPISSWDPLQNIKASMEHANPRESITFSQAVWFYTSGARMQLGLESGKLSPGCRVYLSYPPP